MNLIANWRAVLRHAWSMRFIGLSILFGALEIAMPLFDGLLPISPGMFGALTLFTSIAAGIARLVPQQALRSAPAPPDDDIDDFGGEL